ncbi:MAG: preprotein translocase subunit SecE [Romboutsia timonensis]
MNKRIYLVAYLKTIAELKRVTWSTKKELLKNTGIVLATIISFTILVWALDTLLSGALALIIK